MYRGLLLFRLIAVALILLAIVFSVITATVVHAQTMPGQSATGTTSISNLSYPAEIALSDTSVVVDVSFTVFYANWPIGYALQISITNLTLTNEYPSGQVVSSSPLTCQEFASLPESTTCGVFSTTQPSGSEFVEFALTLPSAGTYTTLAATALFYNHGQILSGSFSAQYLTITVTPSSPSTSLQMQQTPQTTSSNPPSSSNSDDSVLIGIVVGVIALVACLLVYNERRSRQRAAEAQTIRHQERVAAKIEEPKPQPSQTGIPSTATTAGTPPLSKSSMYCSQCGAVISRDSKFCKECGSRQT